MEPKITLRTEDNTATTGKPPSRAALATGAFLLGVGITAASAWLLTRPPVGDFSCFSTNGPRMSMCFRAATECSEERDAEFERGWSASQCGGRNRAYCHERADGTEMCSVTIADCKSWRGSSIGATGCEERW